MKGGHGHSHSAQPKQGNLVVVVYYVTFVCDLIKVFNVITNRLEVWLELYRIKVNIRRFLTFAKLWVVSVAANNSSPVKTEIQ